MQFSRLKLLSFALAFRLHPSLAMQSSRSKSLNLASRFTFLTMQSSHIKSLATLTILCLLPLGLRAQTTPTPIVISDAQTTVQALSADQTLTVEAPDGSVILSTGTAVTGAGTNTITNSGEITTNDNDGFAINITAGGLNLTNNAGAVIKGTRNAIFAEASATIVNSGTIEITGAVSIGYRAIYVQGAANATTLAAQATRPTYDATGTGLAGKWSGYDAYYFNAKITNEVGGIIRTAGDGVGIETVAQRTQIINRGTIQVTVSPLGETLSFGSAVLFSFGSKQSFLYNTGTIRTLAGNAVAAVGNTRDPSIDATEITIHNTGTIESTRSTAIRLQGLSLIVNSGTITGVTLLTGSISSDTLAANPTAPAYDAVDSLRDAYYFNNKIINESGGTIRSNTTNGARPIIVTHQRNQIINHGAITGRANRATGEPTAAVAFLSVIHPGAADDLAHQNFLYNTGSITSIATDATVYALRTINYAPVVDLLVAEVNEIVIHNTGTIENTGSGPAITLNRLNLIVNANAITAGTDSDGIQLLGAADATMLASNPNRPAYDSTQALRDAYYFNNKIINETAAATTDNPTPPTATITGKGTGHGIAISGARAQILNIGGLIQATGSGHGIYFASGSSQSFVQNSGSITSATGNAIVAESGADEIFIHNDGGTIEAAASTAIELQSLNLIVNSGDITGGTDGIRLDGTANANTITANPDRPAYDTTDAALRDAYYFNNTIINETGGTITGAGAGHGINIGGARAQILNNGGDIVAEGTGHGIYFNTGSGEGFVYNTGNITAASGNAIVAESGVHAITIHNTGTIESMSNHAIVLRSLNLIVNSNAITGGTGTSANGHGINLSGTALAATVTDNPNRPAYDAADAVRDAYYFNNTIINETGGTITGAGAGHGINIGGARAQILNNGGDIVAEGTGHGIVFNTGSGQGFVSNSGSITGASGAAIWAVSGIDAITIHNNGGTLESTSGVAIQLQSLNLIVNSGAITGQTNGIQLLGTALAATVTDNPNRPAYDAADGIRDAYYFNNKVINEVVGTNSGTITGKGSNHGIRINGARAQVLNTGGTITAEASGQGIVFHTGSGQGFVQNSGSITSASANAIHAVSGIDEITIHNTGTIESTSSHAIILRSLNLVVNSSDITGGTNGNGIQLSGTALQATLDAQATRPAYDASDADRDAYYFNNKVINEVVGTSTGTITGKGTNHGIRIDGARAQILNTGGDIVAEASGNGIRFNAGSGQGFVQNSGNITSASGAAIGAISGIDAIIIHNTGTMESTSSHAIVLQSLNLVVNSGDITGGTDSDGIQLAGTPLQATLDANPTAPAWDASETDRDAYYFNNIIINEVGGTITGKGTDGHGIHIVNKRAQIFNYGDIDAEGTGHGIYFAAGSGESIVVNTGNIRSVNGWGIYADDATDGAIVVINGGCIEGGLGAIRLSGANDILVIRSGSKITGSVDFDDGSDELIYASAEASGRLADDVLLNLETTSESDSTSDLGAVTPEPTPTPDSDPDSTPDPNDGSGGGPNDGSGGGGSGSGSGGSLGNYQSLFALSDELILDLNAGIQDALYEHNFSFNSEKFASGNPSENTSENASENASEDAPWWTQAFGSLRTQDETDDNAKASHTLGGILLGYDLTPDQVENLGLPLGDLGFFLGVAIGSLSTDDDAELTSQNLFGGVNFQLTDDEFFYGVNFTLGFTSHKSERSVKESGETVKIKGDYTGFFLSPEFIIGMKTQIKFGNTAPKTDSFWERMKAQVNGVNIIPSFRARYLLAFLGEYDEDGSAANRISAEKRNTGTIESRAQVAFPLQLANQAWKLEPRLGLQYRFDLNKSDFDVENLETATAIDYDAEKESTLGIFGGLSVAYLKANTAFKFNVDTIYGSESLVLRAQAGFGFQF